MPGQVRALDALTIQEAAQGGDEETELAVSDLLGRAAVAGEVERVVNGPMPKR
jgi:hypothetical protein